MERIKTDICVIGAGSGGLSVAAGAVQMGAQTALIEGHKMGGDCLNYGCVPSKALIAAANHAHALRNGARYGIADVEPDIDFAAVKDHVRRAIETIEPVDSEERFTGLGVNVIRAHARFVSPTEVEAGGRIVTARRFVIATGSSPLVPPIEGLDEVPYLTNETLFDQRERPEHLIIIGGGPIGMEMAQAHRRLGCDVTVLEGARALGKDDPDLSAVVLQQMREEGVTIAEGQNVARVSGREGAVTVTTESGESFSGSHLLIAVGRKLNIEGLDLEKANIAHDRAITVGDDLRSTSNRRVYAIGDVAGGLQFTHVAGYHAGVVLPAMLFGLPSKARTHHLPWVTYTSPELAQVGMTEAQAREVHGDKLTVARFDMAENDRAIAEDRRSGFAKVMVVGGRPVGASIVGAKAGDLIGYWAMAIANKLKMKALSDTVLPYPTMSEINKRAAGAYFSPKLFDSTLVKNAVGTVQRFLP